jgi:hypothetical protein
MSVHIVRRSAVSLALRSRAWMLAAVVPIGLAAAIACNDSTAPGPPTRLLEVRFREGGDSVGGTFADTIVVQVTDARGTSVPNTTVNWTASTGTLNSSSSVSDANGNAHVVWSFNISPTASVGTTVGQLTATLANDSSLSLSMIAEHGNAVPVKVGNGDNQSGIRGTTLPQPLTIRVVDQHGNPITNESVYWTTASGSLSMTTTPGTTPTNTLYTQTASDGTTQVYLTLGPTAGPNNVTATMGLGSGLGYASDTTHFSLNFTETATP